MAEFEELWQTEEVTEERIEASVPHCRKGESGFHRPQTGKPGDVPLLNSK